MNGIGDSNGKLWARAVAVCVLLGVAFGAVLFGLCWALQDPIRDIPRWRAAAGFNFLAPAELPFLASWVILGWVGTAVLQRLGHLDGWAIVLGMGLSAGIAVSAALVAGKAVIAPWSGWFPWLIGASGVAVVAVAALKEVRARFG